MIDNTWKPISSKPISMCLTMSNKFSAWRHLVGITYTAPLYYENTLISIKVKSHVTASLRLLDKLKYYHPYNQNKVSGKFHQQVKILCCLSVVVT